MDPLDSVWMDRQHWLTMKDSMSMA